MSEVVKSSGVCRRSFLRRTAVVGASALGLSAARAFAADPVAVAVTKPLRVLVWCEGTAPRSVYPNDVSGAVVEHLGKEAGVSAVGAKLTDPAAGLADETLDAADVLIWAGRLRHDDVPKDRAEGVVRRVRNGQLGLIALHASCGSKPFRTLMGMSCEPGGWREDGRPEHVRIQTPNHPIARGINPFTIPHSDMFAEPFRVPEPESVVLVSAWDQGETVRSGLTWTIGKGRVVYLRSGHSGFPVLFHPAVRGLVTNAALWAGGRENA